VLIDRSIWTLVVAVVKIFRFINKFEASIVELW